MILKGKTSTSTLTGIVTFNATTGVRIELTVEPTDEQGQYRATDSDGNQWILTDHEDEAELFLPLFTD